MLLLVLAVTPAAQAACPPAGYAAQDLAFLRAQGFVLADVDARNALALALLDCLGDPDPRWRDGTAFGAIATWLRADALAPDTVRELRRRLVAQLDDGRDPQGFRRPFAALVLAEVARADRLAPLFDAAERAALIDATVNYLDGLRDYRGFHPREGWRHGVAHASDLVLELVSSPAVAPPTAMRLLDALARQVAPSVDMAYVHGEPERIARAAHAAWQREDLDPAWWERWFERVGSPAPLDSWQAAFASRTGLARRHNARAFLLSLAHLARRGDSARDATLLARCDRLLARIDGG